jgi:hypothetical protein
MGVSTLMMFKQQRKFSPELIGAQVAPAVPAAATEVSDAA